MTSKSLVLAFQLGLVAFLLTGCTSPAPSSLEHDISQSLNEGDPSETTVNFDQIVPGDWDEMVIVCRGATDDDLGQYGATVRAGADIDSPAFLALMLFMDHSDAVSQLDVGQNASFTTNFTPCLQNRLIAVSTIARVESELTFRYDGSSRYWYLADH